MILCVSQTNVVTTVYDIFHLYISYHSSSSIYVDLIAPVANVICYYTTSTINKYFLSYLIFLAPGCSVCGDWSARLLAVKQSALGHNIPYGRQFVIQTSCAYMSSVE